jgi:ribA/ribD-fused uncharacterized protein
MDNVIDSFSGKYEFLSNFYPSAIRFEGAWYYNVENSFQAAKTIVPEERRPFMSPSLTPGQGKRLGRQLTLRSDWEDVKTGIMKQQLLYKFDRRENDHLSKLLLDTGDAILIEGNRWHDQVWGDCRCSENMKCASPGQNRLGKVLMEIREELQCQS